MSKYDQIIEWIKHYWITAVILLIIVSIMSVPQIRNGVVLICSWCKTLFNRKRDSYSDEPIILEVQGEKVTFTEKFRSFQHDVVKVHAHTHVLGVAAEYKWIRRRYPNSKTIKQTLTTLDLLTGKKRYKSKQLRFDVIEIKLPNGLEKEIYFDISSFFGEGPSSLLDPSAFIARKIEELYKE